ncbi:formin-like protein 6 [Iris pallida]|uniref:Formin-like protein 6 n=1 Tax=Iris pallida TaxID=29817 RepID=A0AAX6HBV2_IRIPA|nr:formin-like protein 6 [Iris pallida]
MARRHRKGAELEVAPARRRCSKIRQSWQSGSGSASGDKGHRGFLRRDRRRGHGWPIDLGRVAPTLTEPGKSLPRRHCAHATTGSKSGGSDVFSGLPQRR